MRMPVPIFSTSLWCRISVQSDCSYLWPAFSNASWYRLHYLLYGRKNAAARHASWISPIVYESANKTLACIVGQIVLKFRFKLNEEQASFPVMVSPDIEGIIFGLDLLKYFECSWNMKIDSAILPVAKCNCYHINMDLLFVTCTLPTQLYFNLVMNMTCSYPVHTCWWSRTCDLEATQVMLGVVAASVAVPCCSSDCIVKVLNTSTRPCTLKEGALIGYAYPFYGQQGALVANLDQQESTCQQDVASAVLPAAGIDVNN